MGDSKRFNLFACFIEHHSPNKSVRIADVAAGKGYLSLALRQLGFKNVFPFEPNPRGKKIRGLNLQARNFDPRQEKDRFDIIVGMHPDAATDIILDEAIKTRAKTFIVPCCAIPSRWIYWEQPIPHFNRNGIPPERSNTAFSRWIHHLEKESLKKGLRLKKELLPMQGRNIVLFG